jgi:hypothetical protein
MSAVRVKTIGAVYVFPLIIFFAVAISLTQRRILITKNY